jgi:hypothetical protein
MAEQDMTTTADPTVVIPTPDASASSTTPTPEPIAETPAAPAPIVVKLPDGVTDDALVQRIVADATARGLTPEAAQAMLDARLEERTALMTATKAEYEAIVEAWKPGGTEWVKRDAEWRAANLANPEIGGSPEKLAQATEYAQQVIAKYGGDEMKQFLDETGFGSHPAALQMLARIGRAMSESPTLPLGRPSGVPKTAAQILYPQTA